MDVAVINPRYFKPLDRAAHEFFGGAADVVATLEDHVAMGGYGSAVLWNALARRESQPRWFAWPGPTNSSSTPVLWTISGPSTG